MFPAKQCSRPRMTAQNKDWDGETEARPVIGRLAVKPNPNAARSTAT
jgi:hypothetical protein